MSLLERLFHLNAHRHLSVSSGLGPERTTFIEPPPDRPLVRCRGGVIVTPNGVELDLLAHDTDWRVGDVLDYLCEVEAL